MTVVGITRITSTGAVKQLDGKAEPDQQVTEADVQDAPKLARLLTSLLKDVATLRRRFRPRRVDFENITCSAGGVTFPLQHRFGGKVRWWVVEWQITGGSGAPILQTWTGTDSNTLVLWSDKAGIATIRVEESG